MVFRKQFFNTQIIDENSFYWIACELEDQ